MPKETEKEPAREGESQEGFLRRRKTPFLYALALFLVLTFLKLATADIFQKLVEAFLTFLPMAIILYIALASYLEGRKAKDRAGRNRIRFHHLKNGLFLLFITLLFYLLYSPASFSPTLSSLKSSLQIFSKENFFLLAAYLSLFLLALSVFFFFRKKRTLSFSQAFKKTIIPYFFFLVFLFSLSAFAYPRAYSPLTNSLGDIIYTLSGEKVKVLKPETAAYQKLGSLSQTAKSLQSSLSQTRENLSQNVQTARKDFQDDLKNTKEDLSQNIIKSNEDLKRKLSEDIEDKLSVHGATMKGNLTLEDNLKAKDTIYSRDILPESDDSYDLGSPSSHYRNLYIQNIHGSSPVTIGNHGSTHSLGEADDLIVSGSLEVDGTLHADGNINLHGHTIENLQDPQASQDAATKLYVDNQLGQATLFEKQDQTVFTETDGDNLDIQTGSLLASGLQISSSLSLPENSVTNQFLQNSQIPLALGEGLSGGSTLTLGEAYTLSSSLGSQIEASEIQTDSLGFAQFSDSMTLDAGAEIDLSGHNFTLNLSSSGDFRIEDEGTLEHIFDSSGNVGLGMASPSYKLDVDGTVNAQDYYYQGSTLSISASLGEGLSGDDSLILGEAFSLSSILGDSISADEVDNNTLNFAQFSDSLSLDADTSLSFSTHDFSFNLSDSGDLKIQDEGVTEHIFTSGGQVGIGTDSPSYLLDAGGTVNAQSYYLNGSALAAADVNALPQANPILTTNLQTSSFYLSGDGGNEGIYIDAQGDVGINTDSPKTDLDVQGALKTGFRDSACDSDREGAQRYSPDQQAMNYCDGSDWRQYNTPGCPSTVEDADGNTYKTVQIGDQCWMAENLNVGVMVDSVDTGATHSDVSDNGTIEKYCYGNDPANCETDGGLYDWNEAMGYTTTEGAQGICPAGWHIPTDEEFKTLEQQLGMSSAEADDTFWRGTDEGDKLKVRDKCEAGENCDASLFSALMAGHRRHEGPFSHRGAVTGFWSSSEGSSSGAWWRYLRRVYSDVRRDTNYKEYGFSLRCLKD
ncbi:MAG: FISUMP domain-containing protein [Candidatus Moranbacteria bacterium]|nr:FISUMP domain-containing protein [Candidatus Moranbacteria bacterium]